MAIRRALLATDDGVRYFAHLFLGAEHERRNDLDPERRELEAAMALGPFQTSYVGLSQVEAALGHGDRARDIAREYLSLTRKVEDPWWDYRLGFDVESSSWLHREARHQWIDSQSEHPRAADDKESDCGQKHDHERNTYS